MNILLNIEILIKKEFISNFDLFMRKHRGGASFTHFASLPFITVQQRELLSQVQEKVYNSLKKCNLHKCLKHNNPNLFHLTLSMLTLPHTNQRLKAQQVLQKTKLVINQLLQNSILTVQDISYFTRRNHENKRSKDNSKGDHINVIYLNIKQDENYRQVEKVVDFIIRLYLKQQIIADTELRSMNIEYDHNSNMFKNRKLHITLFRCDGLSENQQFLQVYKQIKDFYEGKKLGIQSIDISTRFDYDESKFYTPLYRIPILRAKVQK